MKAISKATGFATDECWGLKSLFFGPKDSFALHKNLLKNHACSMDMIIFRNPVGSRHVFLLKSKMLPVFRLGG